jgi:hypothetical protein
MSVIDPASEAAPRWPDSSAARRPERARLDSEIWLRDLRGQAWCAGRARQRARSTA